MNAAILTRLLAKRRTLAQHDRWSRRQLEQHQAGALRDLRDYAGQRSALYGRLHRGLEDRPLHELPVVTKAMLMDAFDEAVTDPDIHHADLQAFLADMQGDAPFLGRYRVAATSGSTGHQGLFLWDMDEWTWVLASYARANDWAGLRAGLLRHTSVGLVSSKTPWHQSAVVGASLDSRLVRTLRLAATDPLARICADLDAFQPENLVGYASMVRILAEEQLAGRLHLSPRAVMCASEVLTADSRKRILEAFRVEPFDVYGATETATVASECDRHRGMHLCEDLVITEVVDADNQPVAPGTWGAKVLVTVLFSRTLPLIRYEMTDSPMLSGARCDCGRPYALISGVQGRSDETLWLPGSSGKVAVHPVVFHGVLEAVPARGWQVVLERDQLRVEILGPGPDFDPQRLASEVSAAVATTGASAPRVAVVVVPEIRRGATGKAPLVRVETA